MKSLWVVILSLLIVTVVHSQTYNVLYKFGSNSGDPANPSGLIAQGRDGNLFSTTYAGGSINDGTVFQITPAGSLTLLHDFNGVDGWGPDGGLSLGTDGLFSGSTQGGGLYDGGIAFKMTQSGTLMSLHPFQLEEEVGPDGSTPFAAPVEGMDGDLYGTTLRGGGGLVGGYGSVYKITRSGAYQKLHGFDTGDSYPRTALVQGIDGKLYGTASLDAIFTITEEGEFRKLFDFNFHLLDGEGLYGPLVQGSDGNFYGSALGGGSMNLGTVFKMTPNGTIRVLHNFSAQEDDGLPVNGLVQATDGNFYGTTEGVTGCGNIFRITPAGSLTTLYTLPPDGSLGCYPSVTLLQHTNGVLYGGTRTGGSGGLGGAGVLFSLNLGLPPFVRTLPEASRVGQTVGIFGQGFTGATAVNFNGTSAQFSVVSDTYLTAPVPSGATTGFVTVTRPAGTLTSNKRFQVRPQVLSFSPASGPVGTMVVINGLSLGDATRVTFDGVDATFTQNSATQLTATVPAGALTGHVGVTTTGAASYGHTVFTVTQ